VLWTIVGPVGLAPTAVVCLLAATLGDRLERQGAVAVAGGAGFTLAMQALFHRPGPTPALLLGDAGVMCLLIRLTWRTDRFWTVFAVGAQGLVVMLHLIKLASPHLPVGPYLRALSLSGLGVLASLGSGATTAVRARFRRVPPSAETEP